jgi:FMN reductase
MTLPEVSVDPMSDLVLLIGNPRSGSRTRAAAERLAALIGSAAPDVVELADATGVTYSAGVVAPARPDPTALDRVRAARVLVVASPAYKGTFTGLVKLFLDRLPHLGLDGVTAVPLAVAASPAHADATAADLARVLRELGATVPARLALLETALDGPEFAEAAEPVRARLVPHVGAN